MKNWKTTIIGIILGALGILQTTLTAYQAGTPIQWLKVVICIGGMAFALVCKDFNVTSSGPTATVIKPTLVSLCAFILIGCASTQTQLVSGTLSNGDQFPICLEVTQQSPIGGVTLLAAFCATVQTQIDTKAAEYRTLYPNATITELMGPETKKL